MILSEQLLRARRGFLLRFLVGTIPGSLGQQADGDGAVKHTLTLTTRILLCSKEGTCYEPEFHMSCKEGSILPRFYHLVSNVINFYYALWFPGY